MEKETIVHLNWTVLPSCFDLSQFNDPQFWTAIKKITDISNIPFAITVMHFRLIDVVSLHF